MGEGVLRENGGRDAALSGWRGLATDTARCLRFYSRLPVPALPWEDDPHGLPDFSRMTRMLPLAGALIGMIGGGVLWLALGLGLGPFLAAAFCFTCLTLATGAFHEDGLADTFDAFGGGVTVERRLEIMKDSRIGSFGGAALVLAFALRLTALAELAARLDPGAAVASVVIAAALSRTTGLMPLTLLPPARLDGASAAVGRPSRTALTQAFGGAGLLALVMAAIAGLGFAAPVLATALAAGTGLAVTAWSRRMIGGQTGDVAGTAQQAGEIAALTGLLILAAR